MKFLFIGTSPKHSTFFGAGGAESHHDFYFLIDFNSFVAHYNCKITFIKLVIFISKFPYNKENQQKDIVWKKLIKWGILGTSFISEVMAKAITESQTSELVAIGSRAMVTAKSFADKFAVPKPYDNYQELLNDESIEAIYIGLPNHLHKEWIIKCAKAGKHILCEKPFVVSTDGAHEVIAVVKHAKVFCMEALMYRCHPLISKLQELVRSHIIGEIKLYNATYTANIADIANPTAGGSIRNLGCYPVSLVRLLANSEPVELLGTGRMNSLNQTDNQASAILKFADTSMAVISTADDIEMFWQFELYGTKGRLKVITNPWFPDLDNQILIDLNNDQAPIEINVRADRSLYTYQIDFSNDQIIKNDTADFNETFLLDSLGNTAVLEQWLQQALEMRSRTTLCTYGDGG